jgi:hypothetical protein
VNRRRLAAERQEPEPDSPRQSVGDVRHRQATGAAASMVLKLMVDPNVPAAVRLRAAECVFEID